MDEVIHRDFSANKTLFTETSLQIKSYSQRLHMEISFWYVKGDIPNEKIRLPPLEVHFRVGGCGRTCAGEAGQE